MSKGKKDVDAIIEEEAAVEEEASEEAADEGDSAASQDWIPGQVRNDEGGDGEGAEGADARYLRLAADFQNYKKRTEKERFERYSDGKKDFAADILPVLDNFDRALAQDAAAAADDHDRAVIEGFGMILRQFLDVLAKNGVVEIESIGEEFDPNVHHAVVMEPSENYGSGEVSEVLQKGYRIGDKVIRPAMVKVAE